jgi:3-oxoacyl-[acyl-carrier protein] reductase
VLLEGKNAVIYGGGGKIGGAVARAFAREGARVFLAGRTLSSLDQVAEQIRSAGGAVETAQLDALDETAVDEHADSVAAKAGSIDISFNAISHGDVQGTPLADMSVDDFMRPVVTALRSQFLTAKAAARHMTRQGSGVILLFGGLGGYHVLRDYMTGGHQHPMGGTQVTFGALDILRRQLATELGPHGIRVLALKSGGVPETMSGPGSEIVAKGLVNLTMLKRPETLEDIGNVAVFAASDLARSMTATALNITYGMTPD